MQQSLIKERVVDPVLSNIARTAQRDMPLVGRALFPEVPVMQRGGHIITFGDEDFRRYNIRRAPGADFQEIQFGHEGAPFALVQDGLAGKVPIENEQEAARIGISKSSRAIRGVFRIINRHLEIEQGEMAVDPNNYDADHKVDLAGASWNDDANNPVKHVETGRESIADSIGAEPNTLVLSRAAFRAAKNNANVIERYKHVQGGVVTKDMLAELFEVDNLVVASSFYKDDNGIVRVWGQHAVLAYTSVGSMSNEEPSFGYTYELEGAPTVWKAWWNNSNHSMMYPVTYDRKPVIAGSAAGYLLQNAGAPVV